MKAFVSSIGEVTTELCVWSLERNGFEVVLVYGDTSLASKLEEIYLQAEDDFVRIDADLIPNRNLTPENLIAPEGIWWVQYQMFDWFRQDVGYGGVQFIKREALPALRANVAQFKQAERPETELSRIKEFYEPRRFASENHLMGVHNYKNDLGRVKGVKANRGQSHLYDWELTEKLEAL